MQELTPIDLNESMTRVISHLSAPTWVGRDLARNEEWYKADLETTANVTLERSLVKRSPL